MTELPWKKDEMGRALQENERKKWGTRTTRHSSEKSVQKIGHTNSKPALTDRKECERTLPVESK